MINHKVSVAPMLDWTDKHCRYLHRLISKDAVLYSEMITAPAILNGQDEKYIGFNIEEHPVVLQLGGSDAKDLAASCKMAEDYGYDEVNLNIGCPSDRVQKGRFGVCLMLEPKLVQECLTNMQQAVSIPITAKCRIGVDEQDSYEFFRGFANAVHESGVKTLIVHARKAWLKGLSPKQNRTVPPLHHDYVYRLKQDLPDMTIVLNGGVENVEQAKKHLEHCDGVMLGRAIWNNPWILNDLQNELFETQSNDSRDDVLNAYIEYCKAQINKGVKLHWLTPPILGLFHGLPGNKKWKSHLVNHAPKRSEDTDVFHEARKQVSL